MDWENSHLYNKLGLRWKLARQRCDSTLMMEYVSKLLSLKWDKPPSGLEKNFYLGANKIYVLFQYFRYFLLNLFRSSKYTGLTKEISSVRNQSPTYCSSPENLSIRTIEKYAIKQNYTNWVFITLNALIGTGLDIYQFSAHYIAKLIVGLSAMI